MKYLNITKQVLIIVALLALGFAAYLTGDGLCSHARRADVVIVFGSMVDRSGAPSGRLKARLEKAVQLYKSKVVSAIIVSGGVGKEGFDEAAVMKAYLIQRGVSQTVIYADGQGNNTLQTCRNARRIMTLNGWHSANIVSQFFHITRAKLACYRAGINVVGAAAPKYFELRDIYSLIREIVALPVYWIKKGEGF